MILVLQRAAVRKRQEFVPDQPISYETTLDERTTYGAMDFLDTTGGADWSGRIDRPSLLLPPAK